MSAYCLMDIVEITDLAALEHYRHHARAALEKHGGRYVLAGGAVDVVEGDWQPTFPILIEFPSRQQAHRWYELDEYCRARTRQQFGMKVNVVIVEGMLEGFGRGLRVIR